MQKVRQTKKSEQAKAYTMGKLKSKVSGMFKQQAPPRGEKND